MMRAFIARDPSAAVGLYGRVADRIYRLGSILLRDGRRAEDLVVTTLVHAWLRGPTFDPRTIRLDAWVLGIARDLALSVLEEVEPDADPAERRAALRRVLVAALRRPRAPADPHHASRAVAGCCG